MNEPDFPPVFPPEPKVRIRLDCGFIWETVKKGRERQHRCQKPLWETGDHVCECGETRSSIIVGRIRTRMMVMKTEGDSDAR